MSHWHTFMAYSSRIHLLFELCVLFLHLTYLTQFTVAVTSPPEMVRQPPAGELLFQVARDSQASQSAFIIECEAKGKPTPSYTWYKNGRPFRWAVYSSRITLQRPDVGTLLIKPPRDDDAGVYQCRASNKFGTAVSNSVHVRKSVLGSFKKQPAISVSANEGDRLQLDCTAPDGYPSPSVQWMVMSDNGGLRSINSSRMTVDPDGTLWFSNVTLADSSDNFVYACSASSHEKTEYKVGNRVRLNVVPNRGLPGRNRRPLFEQYVSPRTITALRGRKLQLWCIFGGTPLPQVSWQRSDGGLRVDGRRVRLDNYGKTLVIEPVDFDDEGDYICTANNGVGQPRAETFTVKLEAEPYFVRRPRPQMAAEGDTVVFVCSVGGRPPPRIHWTFNGRRLTDGDDDAARRRTSASGDRLSLVDLRTEDTANYGCNATNRLGYIYQDVYVNVLSLPAEIIRRPQDTAVVEAATVQIECKAFGAPRPTVFWRRADSSGAAASTSIQLGAKYTTDGNNSLIIRDVEFSDAGVYICVASNKFGEDRANGTLVVKERTRITQAPRDTRVLTGSSVTLSCRARADPSLSDSLSINWEADSWLIDPLTDSRYMQTSDGALTITSASVGDTMNYTCVVVTSLDRVTATAAVIVESQPDSPTLLRITCREREMDVEWRANAANNAPLVSFTIQLNTSFARDTWHDVARPPPTADSFTVPLSPWANYSARVLARNRVGPSAPSSVSTRSCRTPMALPMKNPDQVAGRGSRPDNLVISWKPMPELEHNAPDFHYLVSWRRDSLDTPPPPSPPADAAWQHERVRDWQQHNLVIDRQPTYQPYRVKVQAVNRLGASVVAAEEVLAWSGEDVPTDAPANFNITRIIDGKRAEFSWSPVDKQSLRGEFKGYKIESWSAEVGKSGAHETVFDANQLAGVVEALRPYTLNFAHVRVFNGAYNGPVSNTISFQMPEGVPSAVDSLDAVALGGGALYLTWRRPARANGRLTGYVVQYQRIDGVVLAPVVDRRPHIDDADATRAILGPLLPNTAYRVTVLATTRAGRGDARYVERRTGDGEAQQPDRPTFLWSYISPDTAAADTSAPKESRGAVSPEQHHELLPTAAALEDTRDSAAAATAGDDHRLKITWLPNLEGHPGTHFFVQYRKHGEQRWTEQAAEKQSDWAMLRQLDPAAVYEVRVVSVDGPFTQPSDIQQVIASDASGPAVEASAGHVTTSAWFIGLLSAVLLLLLIIVLVSLVCVAVRRNRHGGKYDVYGRELTRGRRDLNDDKSFQELHQPLDSTDAGGGGRAKTDSIGSSTKLPLYSSDDTDSMAEYGDDATGRFTEDGSFIGQYGAQKRNGNGHNGVAYV